MKKIKLACILVATGLSITSCSYIQFALKYAKKSRKRVNTGYDAKAKVTKYLVEYLKVANKWCGIKVEIVDGKTRHYSKIMCKSF